MLLTACAALCLGGHSVAFAGNFGSGSGSTGAIGNVTLPTISISNATVTEGDLGTITATFTVNLSTTSSDTVTVEYASANNTATAGSDYTAVSGTLTFAPGQTVQTVGVNVLGDTLFEGNESFFLSLSNAVNGTISINQGVGTISDDDAAASIAAVSGNNQTTLAGTAFGAPLVVEARNAAGNTVRGVTITYTAPGTGASARFSNDSSSLSVVTDATGKTSSGPFSANETGGLNYAVTAQAAGGTQPSTTFTLSNQPLPTAKLSIDDVTVTEGTGGTTVATFTVTADPVDDASPVTVSWSTADQTARNQIAVAQFSGGSFLYGDGDYQSASGTLTFAPGVATQTISVTINGDQFYEADEQFTVSLSGPTNAQIVDGTGVCTIVDNDPVPTFSISDVTMTEGDSGTKAFVFTVLLSSQAGRPTSVDFATADGTAVAGTDYNANSGTLTFSPATFFSLGEQSKQVTVYVNGDTSFELDKTFSVVLSNPSQATIAKGEGVGTISNDDAKPQLSVSTLPTSVTEGNSGTATPVTFTVKLNTPSVEAVTVDYATVDGGATAAQNDYVATNGTLTFAPGETQQTFVVVVQGDEIAEADDAVNVHLSNPVNATFAPGGQNSVAFITNDDSVVVTANTASLPAAVTSLVIAGTGFDPVADRNSVAFNLAAVGTVTAATGQSLTVTLSTKPTAIGALTAVVTTNGVSSGAAVNVATVEGTLAITAQPENATADPGSSVSFSAAASGLPAPTVKWQVSTDGASFDDIPGAAATTYTFTASRADQGKKYRAVFTNSGGDATTNAAALSVDQAPVAVDDLVYFSPARGQTPLAIDAVANDSDPESEMLTITAVTQGAHGTVSIVGAGASLSYTPSGDSFEPDSFTYTIGDGHNGSATATVTISNQIDAQVGTYHGLVQAADGTTASNAQAGLISVTIARKTGKFTGSLKLAGETFPLSGRFAEGGEAVFGKGETLALAIKRKKASALNLTLSLALDPIIEKLEGTLTDNAAPFATISAERASYTAAKNPVPPYEATPVELVGKYTVRLAALAAPNQDYQANQYPQGDGVGILTVSTSGTAKLTGTFADGTNFSYSNSISRAKHWPFYVPVVKGTGSVSGYVTFRAEAATHSDLDGLGLQWYLPASANATRYGQGWPNGVAVDLLGSILTVPSAKSGLSVLDAGSAQPAGNVSLRLKDGGLSGSGVEQAFNLTAKASAVAIQPNPTKATLSVPRTGYFSGAFRFPDTNKAGKYKGIIFQGTGAGYGFFLGATEDGSVSLVAP